MAIRQALPQLPSPAVENNRLMGRMRLKHLRLIEVLSRVGSLRQAAQDLNMTQPAATKILQDLEDLLGVQLFDRRARSITINDFGRFVALHARRVLGETDRFGADLATLVRSGHGTLTIGAIMVTAANLLPAAVMELKRLRPGITVRIVESSSERLLASLDNNEFDFVICRFVDAQDRLKFEIRHLSEEPLCLFTSARGTAADGARSLADLHGLQWVIQDSLTPTRRLLADEFAGAGLPLPQHLVQTGSVYTMLNLIDKVGMVGVLPVDMVRNEGARFKVLPIRLKEKLSPYGIVTRRDRELTPPSREFISILERLAPRRGAPARRARK